MFVVLGLGSGPLDKVTPGGWWVKVGIVMAAIGLDLVIVTVLIARVMRVSVMTVAREGVRSLRDDATQTLARARRRLRG